MGRAVITQHEGRLEHSLHCSYLTREEMMDRIRAGWATIIMVLVFYAFAAGGVAYGLTLSYSAWLTAFLVVMFVAITLVVALSVVSHVVDLRKDRASLKLLYDDPHFRLELGDRTVIGCRSHILIHLWAEADRRRFNDKDITSLAAGINHFTKGNMDEAVNLLSENGMHLGRENG